MMSFSILSVFSKCLIQHNTWCIGWYAHFGTLHVHIAILQFLILLAAGPSSYWSRGSINFVPASLPSIHACFRATSKLQGDKILTEHYKFKLKMHSYKNIELYLLLILFVFWHNIPCKAGVNTGSFISTATDKPSKSRTRFPNDNCDFPCRIAALTGAQIEHDFQRELSFPAVELEPLVAWEHRM